MVLVAGRKKIRARGDSPPRRSDYMYTISELRRCRTLQECTEGYGQGCRKRYTLLHMPNAGTMGIQDIQFEK